MNWYWEHNKNQQNVTISTHTIVHTYMGASIVKDVADLPISIFNKKQSKQALQKTSIIYH